jgi:cytochrome c-type biogenesis protein CcmE
VNTGKITKVIIAVVVIGTAAGYLLYQTIESSWVYYYSVDEFVDSPFYNTVENGGTAASKVNESRVIRLAGQIKNHTIVHSPDNMHLDFELAGQKNSVPVRFYGAMPKNFAHGKQVIVEGKIGAEGVFLATNILTKCESKYKVKSQPATDEPTGQIADTINE